MDASNAVVCPMAPPPDYSGASTAAGYTPADIPPTTGCWPEYCFTAAGETTAECQGMDATNAVVCPMAPPPMPEDYGNYTTGNYTAANYTDGVPGGDMTGPPYDPEAERAAMVGEILNKFDKNGDSELSWKEVRSGLKDAWREEVDSQRDAFKEQMREQK
jgi:hypothetical protein